MGDESRRRIMVVNDDTAFLHLMKELLTDEGYEVILHIHAETAWEAIRREQPDLVILDVRMERPEAGWTTLDLLRLDPQTTRIPVIVCTADAVQLRQKAEHLASLGYGALQKPFDLDHLLAAIRRQLGEHDGS